MEANDKAAPAEKKERKPYLYAIAAGGLAAVVGALALAASHLNLTLLESSESIYLSIASLTLITYMLPSIFFCKLRGADSTGRLYLRFFSPRHIYLVILSALLLMTGGALYKILLCKVGLYSGEFAAYANFTNVVAADSIEELIYIAISLILVPALCEEFLFRSILLREYREGRYGNTVGIWLSALLYAILHFSVERFPIYLYAGLLLGVTAILTRSVFASFCVNIAGGFFNLFLEDYIRQLTASEYDLLFFFLMAILFLAVLIAWLSECYHLLRDDGMAGIPLPQPEKRSQPFFTLLSEALLTPTFLLCIALFVVGAVLNL